MTPGGAQESHPKVVVPLGRASGRGDRWQHGRWGHPPITPSICQRERTSNGEQKRTEKHSEVKPGDNVNRGLLAGAGSCQGTAAEFLQGIWASPQTSQQPSSQEYLHVVLQC